MIVARAHPQTPTDEGWRGRVRAVAERGARAVASRSIAALSERDGIPGAEVLLLVPGGDEPTAARAAEAVLREMQAGLAGYTFALGRSRIADGPRGPAARGERGAAGGERRPGRSPRRPLAFEQTGAYRLLLSAMSENPSELQRFYAETVEPLVAYDEQYETELVRHARGVPGGRRQRRGHRPAPVHAPAHDLLPPGARARAVGARRQLERRSREAEPRPEGDARARHLRRRRPGLGGRRRRRAAFRAAPAAAS